MKSALVIGCAANAWTDIKSAFAIARYDAIYCVKQMGIYYPEAFNVWVTLHPEAMDDYERQRQGFGFPGGYQIVAPPAKELGMHGEKGNIARRTSYLWPDSDGSSSAGSGLYGAKVALEDGYDRIVLAGVPMSAEAGHFRPESKNVAGQIRGPVWAGCGAFEIGFKNAVPHLIGKVKSMSGKTKEILGAPTEKWLTAPSGS